MPVKVLRPFAAAAAAATLLGGCSPAAWLPSNASVLQNDSRSAAKSPIVVKPSKLAFTTSKTIKLSISETGYKGAFKVTVANSKVAAFKGHPQGPSAKLKIVARGAGATMLTIADAQGNRIKVPISVTTAVVVIQ